MKIKSYTIFIFLLFQLQKIFSQEDHSQFWLRLCLQHNFNNKISSSLEFHHRTQSMANTESPFRYPLANAIRGWLSYKVSKNQSINFSPYAFFSNDPVVNKAADVLKSNNNEHRIQLQYESKIPLAKKWIWQNREAAEYRIFENNKDLFRLRFREGISYNANNKIQFIFYDELFLNTMNVNEQHFFDQNRIGLQMGYIVDKHIKIDIGSNLIHSLSRTGNDIIRNYMFFWNIQYNL